MEWTVGTFMVKNVITVDSNETVKAAAKLMSEKEIGSLVVLQDKKVRGIVTETDLIRRVLAENLDSEKTLVQDVMSTPPVIVKPSHPLEDAVKLMFQHQIKKLIVVEGEGKDLELKGIITLTDIASIQPALMEVLLSLYKENEETPPKRIQKVIDYYIV